MTDKINLLTVYYIGDESMTVEQQFIIQVLSDFLNNRKTSQKNDFDWVEIWTLSRQHQIGGIVYYQCKDFIPDNVRSYFDKEYSASVYYYLNRQADMSALDSAFRKENIPYFIVKGLAVSVYYPVPELRTMGDTDIVVHPEDRSRARDMLIQNGFHEEKAFTDTEWHYSHHEMDYELHDHLLYDETVNEGKFKDFINDYWDYVQDNKLDPNFHFLFLLIHLRKHLMNSGVGFRQFMDVAVMIKNEKKLNWKWIQEKLEEIGLMEYASICFGFIKKWFGITAPIEVKYPDDEFYNLATKAIFSNGIFGFDNVENKGNSAVNDTRKYNNSRMSVLLTGITRAFPPYKYMKEWKQYSYVDGRPYLMPVAYVHRLARGIRDFSVKKKYIKIFFPSDSEVQKRKKYLEHWGL